MLQGMWKLKYTIIKNGNREIEITLRLTFSREDIDERIIWELQLK